MTLMFTIFASTVEEAQQGWVWMDNPGLPPRSVVKLVNVASGQAVYCEALQIDENFLRHYNNYPRVSIASPAVSIVMNSWYRSKLGILATQSNVKITVKSANGYLGHFMACVHHPQIVIRVAAWLGLMGVVLGVIGVLLGVFSLLPSR